MGRCWAPGIPLVVTLMAVSDWLLLSGRPSSCLGTASGKRLSGVSQVIRELESSRKEIQGRQVGAHSFAETFLQDCTRALGPRGESLTSHWTGTPAQGRGLALNGDRVHRSLQVGFCQGGSSPTSLPGYPQFRPLHIPSVCCPNTKKTAEQTTLVLAPYKDFTIKYWLLG